MTPPNVPSTLTKQAPWWELELLELGDRTTAYAVLVDVMPGSAGIDPAMRVQVEPGGWR